MLSLLFLLAVVVIVYNLTNYCKNEWLLSLLLLAEEVVVYNWIHYCKNELLLLLLLLLNWLIIGYKTEGVYSLGKEQHQLRVQWVESLRSFTRVSTPWPHQNPVTKPHTRCKNYNTTTVIIMQLEQNINTC